MSALAQQSFIRREDVEAICDMVAFRNRVVHGYEETSAERVYEIAGSGPKIIERFCSQILSSLGLEDSPGGG